MPGTAVNTLCKLTHLIPTASVWDIFYYYPYFTEEEIEAGRNQRIYSKSHS